MLIPRVIPCLLLQDEGLVKTVKFKNASYVGDPVNAMKIYNDKEVDELIFLDISATPAGREPNYELIYQVATECFMPLAYGGGVGTIDQMRKIYNLGIEKIAINTHAIEDPNFIQAAAAEFGSQSVVVSVDVKKNLWGKYVVCSNNGQKNSKYNPVEFAQLMEAKGAGELLIHSIDRDGTWKGYDVNLVKKITDAVNVPVIACGGAGKVEDFKEVIQSGGASAVAAGSMVVYQGEGLGVLINFPKRKKLEELLGGH